MDSFRPFCRVLNFLCRLLLLLVLLRLLLTAFFARCRVLKMVRFVVVSASRHCFGNANHSVVCGFAIITSSGCHFNAVSRRVLRPLSKFGVGVVNKLVRWWCVQVLRRWFDWLGARAPTATRVANETVRILARGAGSRRDLFRVFFGVDGVGKVGLLARNEGLLSWLRV